MYVMDIIVKQSTQYLPCQLHTARRELPRTDNCAFMICILCSVIAHHHHHIRLLKQRQNVVAQTAMGSVEMAHRSSENNIQKLVQVIGQ